MFFNGIFSLDVYFLFWGEVFLVLEILIVVGFFLVVILIILVFKILFCFKELVVLFGFCWLLCSILGKFDDVLLYVVLFCLLFKICLLLIIIRFLVFLEYVIIGEFL